MSAGIPLGPYRLMRRLATGGMAEIFLARQDGKEGFSRDLVLKRILPNLALSPEFRRMFRSEARLAALLSHPNIVHVYDYGSSVEADGEETFYLAMELVRGVDLHGLMVRAASDARGSERPFAIAPHHAAKIASFVCEALAYANALVVDGARANIVHRDVTPSNVLLSFDGAVKLADFGIAKTAASDHHTQVGVIKGKPSYLSPEQARGEPLDARSDLFNVGILIFEMVLGQRLFPAGELGVAKQMAARGEIPDRRRIRRLPGLLADITERALSSRAVDRYPDALAMRADLEGFVRKAPEPTGSVEIGELVRGYFPETIAEDRRHVRAAGTIAQADVPIAARSATEIAVRAAPLGLPHAEPIESTLVSSGTIALDLEAYLGRAPQPVTELLVPTRIVRDEDPAEAPTTRYVPRSRASVGVAIAIVAILVLAAVIAIWLLR